MDSEKRMMTFARALFDNVAEMPRELSFKKGDILSVLDEKYENNPEWWVCSLRNVVGLAPANRLEAMPVLMTSKSVCQSQVSASTYDDLPEQSATHQIISKDIINVNNSKTLIPNDDTYCTYELPKEDVYVNTQTNNTVEEYSVYQVPSDNLDETYSNFLTEKSTLSVANTPKDNTIRPYKEPLNSEYHNDRFDYSDSYSDATSSIHSVTPFSMTSSDSSDGRVIPKDASAQLVMTPEEAIAKSRLLQNEITNSCNKVVEFVNAKWKSEEMLRVTIHSIHESFIEFSSNLNILISFTIGVYQNSLNCADVNLSKKLSKHLSPLQDSQQTIKDSFEKLEKMNWDPVHISTSVRLAVRDGVDPLGSMVAAARNVLISIRSLSVTINGNSSILFLHRSPTPTDVVDGNLMTGNIVTKDKIEKSSNVQDVLRLFGQQVQSQTELVNETVNDFISFLSNNDKETHFQETVTTNSKFVVRSATQLVCIAKNLSETHMKYVPCEKIEEAGNKLCDSLKTMINVTKKFIMEKKWSNDQKDQLLRHLRLVNGNAVKLQHAVISSVS